MNLDKAKKRIAKRVKMGFQGYPEITLEYFGENPNFASEVSVTLLLEEGAEQMEEHFKSSDDSRENETIQSAIVKMIERCGAKTVHQKEGVSISSV